MNIVGREKEKHALAEYAASEKPEFLVVYGRRRAGKTFLIKEFFNNNFAFYCTGTAEGDSAEQLKAFNLSLNEFGSESYSYSDNWFDAFAVLRRLLEAQEMPGKKVIFIDELPWLAKPKSKFISAFEYFWNSFASTRPDILLIICGSATSWIVGNIFMNTGGLYGRVTKQMFIEPFTLGECEEFFKQKGIVLNRHQIVESYMIFGGVPYYLDMFDKRYGLPQNVDMLCFGENPVLGSEYTRLYATLFRNYENHHRIVAALANKTRGLARTELLTASKLSNGGGFTRTLDELEQCGFVRKYHPVANRRKEAIYQLIDPFTLFYHTFMKDKRINDENYWSNNVSTASHNAWSGYAFEQVCLAHSRRIKQALGIAGVSANIASWRSIGSDAGAQIDLVIDRRDQIINLCEMKYSVREYEITKSYADTLERKTRIFAEETKTKKALHVTMITTYGVKQNLHRAIVQSEVTMNDLFES